MAGEAAAAASAASASAASASAAAVASGARPVSSWSSSQLLKLQVVLDDLGLGATSGALMSS